MPTKTETTVHFYLTREKGVCKGGDTTLNETFAVVNLRDADARLEQLKQEHGFQHGWWDAGYTASGPQEKYAVSDLLEFFEVLTGKKKAASFVTELQGFRWTGSKEVLPQMYALEFFRNDETGETKTVHSYCFDRSGESDSLAAFSLKGLREPMNALFGSDNAYRELCSILFD